MNAGDAAFPYWIESGGEKNREISGEWYYFRKIFKVKGTVKYAEVKFNSSGVCGLYINSNFVEASTSRYPQRINRHEVTGLLHEGKNLIALKAGSSYFYKEAIAEFNAKKQWDSFIALRLDMEYADGKTEVIITDSNWKSHRKEEKGWDVRVKGKIEETEYKRFWENAAPWRDMGKVRFGKECRAVAEIVGKEYLKELKSGLPEYVFPSSICKVDCGDGLVKCAGNLLKKYGYTVIDTKNGKASPAVTLGFDRTVVGYIQIELKNASEGKVDLKFDYSETPEELEGAGTGIVQKLEVVAEIKPGMKEWFNLRRRAFRYLRITFHNFSKPLTIKSISLKCSYYPVNYSGWFTCSDNLLNEIWKVGRYTLHVNMHQEYESCPRNEMLYFSGDGRMDALIDFYAFGDGSLLGSSLSFNEEERKVAYGLLKPKDGPERQLWDYPAWRIISVKDYFVYKGDKKFVLQHYRDCIQSLEWLIQRMGKNGLIYQIPLKKGHRIVEWTCSRERVGEKTFLNCLLYKSLDDMIFLARVIGDKKNVKRWFLIKEQTRKAINKYLWSREKNAFVDSLFDYVPHDGNTLAVLFGIASKERAKRALQFLKSNTWSPYGSAMFDRPLSHTRNGSKTIAPLMNCYEVESHFLFGLQNDAMELIRRCWGTMLKKGARTFWEFAPNDPVAKWPVPCHAWSGGATYCLSAYVLGVKPAEPGYEKVSIVPMPGDLRWVKGVVPTPMGLIGVSYIRDIEKKKTKLSVLIPRECKSAEIAFPSENLPQSKIYINRTLAWEKGVFKPVLPFVRGVCEKEGYIYFRITRPGKYVITNCL